jgi:CBS domain-containing protein
MATIRELLSNRTIYYVQPDQTVFEAAQYMSQCNVGAVPVLDGTQLVGIFSERDLMTRVVVEGRSPHSTYIAEVMSTDLHAVAPSTGSEEAMCLMQIYGIRHLPVCDGPTLVGFVSLRDLLRCHLDEKTVEADSMRAYIRTYSS